MPMQPSLLFLIFAILALAGVLLILVLKKNTGEVVRVKNGAVGGPVLDVNVNSFSGRGLLGITLHPNFSTNGFVYLYYTKSGSGGDVASNDSLLDNRVERYTWNGNTLVSPTLITSLPADPAGLHVGGIITFGPDGKLYVVIGYNDRNGKLQNNSAGAEPDDTGVVLRLNRIGAAEASLRGSRRRLNARQRLGEHAFEHTIARPRRG